MQTSKLIAKIFYGISKLLAVFYALIFLYSGFCLLTGNRVKESEDGNMLHILYPFSDSNFMNIDDNLPYIIFSFMVPIGLYALFFYLASNMFHVFFQNRLFTKVNIRKLNWFYRCNLFLPLPITILSSFFAEISGSIWMLVFVHFILGILTYFLAQIFKQGLGLQDEQDLFI